MLKLKKSITEKLKVFELTQVDFNAIESLCLSDDKNSFIQAVPVYLDFCEGVSTEFLITKECFEEVLNFGHWYDASLFNGNPDNFILVEQFKDGNFIVNNSDLCNNELFDDTIAFMFLPPSRK